MHKMHDAITSATRQVRQQWFSVCIFAHSSTPDRVWNPVRGKKNAATSNSEKK